MKVEPTSLPEVLIVEPRVFSDERGFFFESYNARRYAESGIPGDFVQDNHSRSQRGTLRGLHYQLLQPQGKLVRVIGRDDEIRRLMQVLAQLALVESPTRVPVSITVLLLMAVRLPLLVLKPLR